MNCYYLLTLFNLTKFLADTVNVSFVFQAHCTIDAVAYLVTYLAVRMHRLIIYSESGASL